MKALVVQEPGSVALVDRPEPTGGEGRLVVRPELVGLCGTDLEIVAGGIDPAYVTYPIVLGHEWTGRAVAGGDAGSRGRRVVVEGIVPCGHCAHCRAGRTNICEVYDEFGFTRDGAAAGAVTVPVDLVHVLDPSVGPEDAVLVEPAAVVFKALWQVGPRPGIRAAVIGDGTVGLLAVNMLGLWSPSEIVMFGRRPAQEELALQAGATRFVTDGAEGGFDLAVEAAGTPEAVTTAVRCVTRGGVVVLLGLPAHGTTVPVVVADLVDNDTTVVASFSYTSAAWRNVVALLNGGRFRPGFLVTHRFPLSRWEEALRTLREPVGARGKVVLTLP